ncbi:gliding motility-associated C-terminal domain-containing protein, partial [Flavobacterium sp.]|uniref:gliding motility-associated C-terminal domain-containing protein n=1 Tax=Flavobacterium sp. TaxID=239 RepID=UPI003528D519
YTFTPDAGQCAAVGTLSVTITDKQPIRFTGIEVCGDTTINFPTVTDEGYTLSGSWSPSTIDTSNGGEKTYTFTPDDICYASGTFTVNVIGCMIPRGISPNGDGLNDTFDLSNFDVKKLEIFNRYGMKVYSKSDYVNEWSGYSDSGDELPDATYYYVIYFNNSPARTGWVYINRQH